MLLSAQGQFGFVSQFGDAFFIPCVVCACLAIYLFQQKKVKKAALMILTLFSFIYSIILKYAFQLPRPQTYVSKHYLLGDSYGFPSSHVTFYTVFWGYILYLALNLKPLNKIYRIIMVASSFYYIILIGASRIALGAHSVKDVVGGYFFGLLFLMALIYTDSRLGKLWDKNKSHDN